MYSVGAQHMYAKYTGRFVLQHIRRHVCAHASLLSEFGPGLGGRVLQVAAVDFLTALVLNDIDTAVTWLHLICVSC